MNISEELQIEINKAKKQESEISLNIKLRNEKLEKKINTVSDEAKLKIMLDNYLNTINICKMKAGDNLGRNKILNDLINEFYQLHGVFKKQIEKVNVENVKYFLNLFSTFFRKEILIIITQINTMVVIKNRIRDR